MKRKKTVRRAPARLLDRRAAPEQPTLHPSNGKAPPASPTLITFGDARRRKCSPAATAAAYALTASARYRKSLTVSGTRMAGLPVALIRG